jgi:hypothetical protein
MQVINENDRQALLTYCGLRSDAQVPAGVMAVYEDYTTMRRRLPGRDPMLALIALIGQASELERPAIPTKTPQVQTVKPKAEKKGKRTWTPEQRAKQAEKMRAMHEKKKAETSNG